MNNFIELLKVAKNPKYLALTLMILTLGGSINFFYKFVKLESFQMIIEIIMSNWLYILYAVVFTLANIFVLLYSDKKSQEKIDEYNSQEESHIVNVDNLISGHIKISQKYYVGRELLIKLNNISNEKILKMNGFISLYKGQVRVKKLQFDINMLKAGYSECIYQSVNEVEILRFEDFDIYINEMVTENESISEIHKMGPRFARIPFVLNYDKYYDKKLFGIKTRFNLVWIKEKTRKVYLYIRFKYSKKNYGKQKQSEIIISFIGRGCLFIVVYTTLFLVFLITVFVMIKILYMFWDLVPLFWDLIKEDINN
ncbi:hypothetical protein [Lysinibacillus sp. BPa_S21]|uniref:hypothetical protein n=1 Tax=Lysinibacillus sp. BPa_S21 TaxID=2932478 RepID=UPI0020120338|nr:hypothetical protein [Lysinibacillus sp. BPa_S21]MCL1696543.1 hypothetical protein [Lysinibacillus sp. BPa_S21]